MPKASSQSKTTVSKKSGRAEIAEHCEPTQDKQIKAKVRRLKISNFGCISDEIDIELDDVVVLVGPNNSGKTTILKAYDIIMGSDAGLRLSKEDFYNGDTTRKPCIILETQVQSGHEPGDCWLNPDDKKTIRERWIWDETKGILIRQGFNFDKACYVPEVPYGCKGYANWHRPKPHRLGAFDLPAERTKKITKLLIDIISDKVKKYKILSQDPSSAENDSTLLTALKDLGFNIRSQAESEIERITTSLTRELVEIFPGHKVDFDANFTPTDEIVGAFVEGLFKQEAKLRFGPESLFKSTIDKQGTGAQRMLMWAVIRYLAESAERDTAKQRSHILLLDEPELCLHPSAIRDVTRTLYDLPKNSSWQVMISTHSPVFLDLSRDNTTIVRVERTKAQVIGSTTVYRRTEGALNIGNVTKTELQLLNLCDPYVTEFFFGGQTLLVEGDTEYAAFRYVMSLEPKNPLYRGLHIVRARGKSTICLLMKLLNAFRASYSVLHDSDTEFSNGDKNSAWKANDNILQETKLPAQEGRTFLVAALPNFELAMFGEEPDDSESKPYFALAMMKREAKHVETVACLLKALITRDPKNLPRLCINWTSIDQLKVGASSATDTSSRQISMAFFRADQARREFESESTDQLSAPTEPQHVAQTER